MGDDDSTRQRLLEAAGEEFARLGFEQATVRAIVKRAGVGNVGAIHYYFGGKEELYKQAVMHAHAYGLGRPEADSPEPGDPEQRLARFVRDFVGRILALAGSADWRQRLLFREIVEPTPASDVLVRESIRPRFERLRGILDELCPGMPERRRNALVFSVIGQCLFYKAGRTFAVRLIGPEELGRLDVDYLTDHIVRVTLAAVREERLRIVAGGRGEPCPGSL